MSGVSYLKLGQDPLEHFDEVVQRNLKNEKSGRKRLQADQVIADIHFLTDIVIHLTKVIADLRGIETEEKKPKLFLPGQLPATSEGGIILPT